MKAVFIFLLLVCPAVTLAQWYNISYDKLPDSYQVKKEHAQLHHIKSIRTFSYGNQRAGEELIKVENYDSTGRILSSTQYYKKGEYHNSRLFTYDAMGRFTGYTKTLFWGTLQLSSLQIVYDNADRYKYMIFMQEEKGTKVNDTIYYLYDTEGRISSKYKKKQPKELLNYFYNASGQLLYVLSTSGDTIFQLRYSIHGCDSLRQMDSLRALFQSGNNCQVFLIRDEMFIRNKWVLLGLDSMHYEGNLLQEQWSYTCSRPGSKRCRGHLVFAEHCRYMYDAQELPLQKIALDRRNRMMGIEKYDYSFYPAR